MMSIDQQRPSLEEIDLATPKLFENGPPHEVFRMLREHDPAHWNRPPAEWGSGWDSAGFWSITKAEDIAAVARDLERFSVERGGFLANSETDGFVPIEAARAMLIGMDPPRHTKYRALLSKAFIPSTVNKQEAQIRNRMTQIIDRAIERGECDFVNDIAVPLPTRVIADLVGFPEEMGEKIHEWSDKVISFQDEETRGGGSDEGMKALTEIVTHTNDLAAERRQRPREDLLTRLVQAEADGEKFDEYEFGSFVAQLLIAGNDTTRHALSGGMKAFFEHPEQWRKLIENPSVSSSAVEEILRWVSPVMYMRRTATQDLEVGGKKIKENDKVLQWYVSANRDPALNSEPERFDVTRKDVKHLSFGGGGRRFCVGAGLSRLELRIAFEELSRRVPEIKLTGTPRWLRSNWFCGLTTMPVQLS
jgi:cytochrome P450